MSSKVHVSLSDVIFSDENRRDNMGQIDWSEINDSKLEHGLYAEVKPVGLVI
jgi:hypothetical protein